MIDLYILTPLRLIWNNWIAFDIQNRGGETGVLSGIIVLASNVLETKCGQLKLNYEMICFSWSCEWWWHKRREYFNHFLTIIKYWHSKSCEFFRILTTCLTSSAVVKKFKCWWKATSWPNFVSFMFSPGLGFSFSHKLLLKKSFRS